MAAGKLTDGLWKLQRHLRITAVALQDVETASFHAVSEAFPVIPKLQVCTANLRILQWNIVTCRILLMPESGARPSCRCDVQGV